MRGCDVCGRWPRWLWCGPYDENPAVFCGFHVRGYLRAIPIPPSWLKPAREYVRIYRRAPLDPRNRRG